MELNSLRVKGFMVQAKPNAAKALAPMLEEREQTPPPAWPERYRALAIKALRHGAMSVGRFAEYLGISRQKAMRYVEQEITDDEKVPVAPA